MLLRNHQRPHVTDRIDNRDENQRFVVTVATAAGKTTSSDCVISHRDGGCLRPFFHFAHFIVLVRRRCL